MSEEIRDEGREVLKAINNMTEEEKEKESSRI